MLGLWLDDAGDRRPPALPNVHWHGLGATDTAAARTAARAAVAAHPQRPVLVLARDGVPSSGSPLWLDTFDVRPGEVWEVVFRASNPGIWMNHCHNLPHADQGMMLRLRYSGIGTPFGGHSGH